MKKIVSKIAAIYLTILVVFSSSFIVIDEHYCDGKLEHFSIFGEAEVCEMNMHTCATENHSTKLTISDCCVNSQDYKFATVFENSTEIKIEFTKFLVISNISTFHTNLFIEFKNNTLFQKYIPPLISKNILILIQCFRI